MNRLQHMLLVAIAAMMSLSACARPAPTVEPVTISFACKDYARDQYVDLVERFEKANRDVRVQIVSAYYISAQSLQPEACWKWLVFLSDRPEVVQKLAARKSIAASPAWQVDESARMAFQATLKYDDAAILRQRWEIPWLGYAYPWLHEAFIVVLAGGDAERALAEAQNKAEALVLCLESEGNHPDALKACAQTVDPAYPDH
ncbi:MAG: hypothetical protein JXA89_04130 [Anaerolineae bacterium]|nr:hypothetical protein [Anaerolineae bacterium]